VTDVLGKAHLGARVLLLQIISADPGNEELKLEAPLFIGVGAPREIPTLGYFRAPLPQETRASLAQLVHERGLLARSGGPTYTPEGSGGLKISGWGRSADVSMAGDDSAVFGFRDRLATVMHELERAPRRALRLGVTATREASRVRATASLTAVGTQPLTVDLFDPGTAYVGARAFIEGVNEVAAADEQALAALVQQGRLPRGVTAAAPGTVYTIPIPPLDRSPSKGGSCQLGPRGGSERDAPQIGHRATVSGSARVLLAGLAAARRPAGRRWRRHRALTRVGASRC